MTWISDDRYGEMPEHMEKLSLKTGESIVLETSTVLSTGLSPTRAMLIVGDDGEASPDRGYWLPGNRALSHIMQYPNGIRVRITKGTTKKLRDGKIFIHWTVSVDAESCRALKFNPHAQHQQQRDDSLPF